MQGKQLVKVGSGSTSCQKDVQRVRDSFRTAIYRLLKMCIWESPIRDESCFVAADDSIMVQFLHFPGTLGIVCGLHL